VPSKALILQFEGVSRCPTVLLALCYSAGEVRMGVLMVFSWFSLAFRPGFPRPRWREVRPRTRRQG
jgi:hypothetical protein